MKKNELVELIRQVVQEELNEHTKQIKKYVRTHVPVMIGEVVHEYISDKLDEVQSLNESTEFETLGKKAMTTSNMSTISNRGKLADILGYGNGKSQENVVNVVVTDSGREVPVESVPDFLHDALNKDYSTFLKKLDSAASGYRATSPTPPRR